MSADGLDVAAAADQIFLPGHLQAARAHFVVAVAHRIHDLRQRNLVGQQPIRIDVDLILLHEPADGGHLRHARHARKPIPQIPIVERAHLLKVVLAGLIDERVLEGPADTSCVRSKLRRHAFGKLDR